MPRSTRRSSASTRLRAYHVRNGNDPFVWEVLQLSYRANGVAPPSTVDWNEPAGKASTPLAGQKVVQPYSGMMLQRDSTARVVWQTLAAAILLPCCDALRGMPSSREETNGGNGCQFRSGTTGGGCGGASFSTTTGTSFNTASRSVDQRVRSEMGPEFAGTLRTPRFVGDATITVSNIAPHGPPFDPNHGVTFVVNMDFPTPLYIATDIVVFDPQSILTIRRSPVTRGSHRRQSSARRSFRNQNDTHARPHSVNLRCPYAWNVSSRQLAECGGKRDSKNGLRASAQQRLLRFG